MKNKINLPNPKNGSEEIIILTNYQIQQKEDRNGKIYYLIEDKDSEEENNAYFCFDNEKNKPTINLIETLFYFSLNNLPPLKLNYYIRFHKKKPNKRIIRANEFHEAK